MDYGWILQLVLPVISAALGWLFSKLQTRREQKQTDLQIINTALKPLLESITDLTDRLKQSTTELLEERERTLNLSNERTEILDKVNSLEKEVKRLVKLVNKLSNKDDDNIEKMDRNIVPGTR